MVSNCGEGAQVLYNIALEGNDVRLHIREHEYRRNWNGLLRQVDLQSSFIDMETIIIFDTSGMGKLADHARKSGYKVIGASRFMDKLEHDRMFGLEFMDKCGIRHPETQEFVSLEAGKSYIQSRDAARLVFKPSGDDLPCHLTYVGKDSEDLIKFIDYAYKYYAPDIKSFVLQEFVEGDIISTELWFDGKKAVYPANHTIEAKKFLNGDLGPSVGCSGNLVWVEFENCRILSEGVAKSESLLLEEGYCGPLDLNAIVNDEGVFGLEWTPRFGYDSIGTFLPLLQMETGKFFADMASGAGDMQVSAEYSGGVRFSIPPYPIEPKNLRSVLKESPNLGIPIRGLDVDKTHQIYFYEILIDKDELVHGDGTGVVGLALGIRGDALSAFEDAYSVIENVRIPDVQYRTDLDKVIPEMYEKIAERENEHAGHE